MPLFRPHRGSLEESLKEVKMISDFSELVRYLERVTFPFIIKSKEVEIRPYPDLENCFDTRIGWYTHIVLISGLPWGFLSEPFRRNKDET